MLSCCLQGRNNTASKIWMVAKPNKVKPILLSKRAVSDNKKLRFIREQEASKLLNSLEIRMRLNQIP